MDQQAALTVGEGLAYRPAGCELPSVAEVVRPVRVIFSAVRPTVLRGAEAAQLAGGHLIVGWEVAVPDVGDSQVRVEQRLGDGDDHRVADVPRERRLQHELVRRALIGWQRVHLLIIALGQLPLDALQLVVGDDVVFRSARDELASCGEVTRARGTHRRRRIRSGAR